MLYTCIYMVPSLTFSWHFIIMLVRGFHLKFDASSRLEILFLFIPILKSLVYLHVAAVALLVRLHRLSVWECCHPGTVYYTAQS